MKTRKMKRRMIEGGKIDDDVDDDNVEEGDEKDDNVDVAEDEVEVDSC